MRIAIISDIHANLPAFEEVLKDIDRQEVDAVYCLGDLVGYNVWPNAVIREIGKRRLPPLPEATTKRRWRWHNIKVM